jgi:hypothetical protein
MRAMYQQYGIKSSLNGKCNPITGLDRPRGFQEVEAPGF